MPYTEFHVTKTSANDQYGGSSEALIDASADCTATHLGTGEHTVVDNVGTSFSNTSVDDFICWDATGGKEIAIVTAVVGDGVTITVQNVDAAVVFSNLGPDDINVNVGGAWATVDHAAETVTTDFVNAAGHPPRVNIKGGVAYNEFVINDHAGTPAIPITFQGYTTSIADGGSAEIDDDTGDAVNAAWDVVSRKYLVFRDLFIVTAKSGDDGLGFLGQHCLIHRCKARATGSSTASFRSEGSLYVLYVDCSTFGGTTYGFRMGSRSPMIGCRTDGCSIGFYSSASGSEFWNCVASNHSSAAFWLNAGNVVVNCTAYDCVRGVRLDGQATYSSVVMNCLMMDNTYGIIGNEQGLVHEDYNAFYNSGDELTNIFPQAGAGDHVGGNSITLTDDPFVNAAGGNFALNNTAGAGAACRDAGYPGAMVDGTNIGHADIGAIQHEDPAGGGGGFVHMLGGMRS